MKWLALLFVVLIAIPVAQTTADVRHGRTGPTVCLPYHCYGNGSAMLFTKSRRHDQKKFDDDLAARHPHHSKTS